VSYIEVSNRDYGFFDADALKAKGSEFNERYVNADPFPHIVLDNFFTPSILDMCLENFPQAPDPDS